MNTFLMFCFVLSMICMAINWRNKDVCGLIYFSFICLFNLIMLCYVN